MFPLAHFYLAEKALNKLNNNIKLGSIIPDFISLSPNITISESHVVITNFENSDFERAWNLHVTLDKYTEKNFFYPLTPKKIERKVGNYVAHLFVETALDYLLSASGIFYEPPRYDERIIEKLEKHFELDFTIIKPIIQLFLNWDKDSYKEYLQYSLLYTCGLHQHVFTKYQIYEMIEECEKVLPNFEEMLNDFSNSITID